MLTTSIPLFFYRHVPCVEPSNATRMKDKKAPRKKKNRATRRTNGQHATRGSAKRYVHTSTHGPWTTDKISDFNYIASGINIFGGSAKYEVVWPVYKPSQARQEGRRATEHTPSSLCSCISDVHVLCALVCMLRLALYCCSTTCNVHRSPLNHEPRQRIATLLGINFCRLLRSGVFVSAPAADCHNQFRRECEGVALEVGHRSGHEARERGLCQLRHRG